MSQLEKLVPYWHCDHPFCGFEWPQRDKKPKQCPACKKRQWDGGARPRPVRLARVLKPKLARIISAGEVLYADESVQVFYSGASQPRSGT
jgi:hypothetical protein